MLRFINAPDKDYESFEPKIYNQCMVFENCELPLNCNPSLTKVGFEYNVARTAYIIYINSGITYTGSNAVFAQLTRSGEKTFTSFKAMVTFIKDLKNIFEEDFNLEYFTKDGQANYKFRFKKIADAWRAYITEAPDYKKYSADRATDLHSTHRLTEGNNYYVCWNTPLKSIEDCKTIAALWADCTQYYIKNGGSFETIVDKI